MKKIKKEVLCRECNRPTTEPRRGLCKRCYLSEYRGGKASECEVCGYEDPRVLVRRRDELNDEWITLCGNCAVIRGRRKLSIEELRAEVFPDEDRRNRNRRSGRLRRRDERRSNDDLRLFERTDSPKRRQKDRRKN